MYSVVSLRNTVGSVACDIISMNSHKFICVAHLMQRKQFKNKEKISYCSLYLL